MNLKHKLYLNRLLSSWGDRTWDFAIGLFLVKVYPTSLLLAAIQGILASSAVIIFAPIFGRWIEKASRIQEVKICLFIQNGSVVMSSAFVALYFSRESFNDPFIEDMISSFAPFILVTFSVIAQVTSAGYTLCLEKDWLLALARDEAELTDLNAMLRRLDLCCQTIAPFLVGILMQHSELGSALFLMLWNFFSGFSEYAVLKSIYNMGIPSLLKPKDKTVLSDNVTLFDIDALKKYKKSFLLPGIACGLAYLSILGFDSVTIGYITNRGPEEGLIGIFSLFGALFGIMGTIMFQWLAKSFSLRKAGLIGFIIDLSALSLCLWVVEDFGLLKNKFISDYDLPTILFLTGIAISRAGIWTIDLSMNQMIQVETNNPPLIGGVQTSVNIFSELTKFILVAFLPALSSFWILILVSYFSIMTGFILFLIYLMTDERQIVPLDANEKFTYGTLNEYKS